jgi:mannose/fructose/N-acetylgalactosamine-specific phosphotransferase system component IIC
MNPRLYGLVAGAFNFLWISWIHYAGLMFSEIYQQSVIAIYLITPIFCTIAIFRFKQTHNKKLSYNQGFKAGLTVAGIAAIISGLSVYYYHSVLNPEFFDQFLMTLSAEDLAKYKAKPEVLEDIRKLYKPYNRGLSEVSATLALGAFGSLVATLAFRNAKETEVSNSTTIKEENNNKTTTKKSSKDHPKLGPL